MIFIEQKRAKTELNEHPATHTSPTKLKSNVECLTLKINAKTDERLWGCALNPYRNTDQHSQPIPPHPKP